MRFWHLCMRAGRAKCGRPLELLYQRCIVCACGFAGRYRVFVGTKTNRIDTVIVFAASRCKASNRSILKLFKRQGRNLHWVWKSSCISLRAYYLKWYWLVLCKPFGVRPVISSEERRSLRRDGTSTLSITTTGSSADNRSPS